MISVSVSVDVPDMTEGIRFYERAFGFAKIAEPFPGVVVLKSGDAQILLLEKAAGLAAVTGHRGNAPATERHWTPVHIDFHVDDFNGTLASDPRGRREAGAAATRTRSTDP